MQPEGSGPSERHPGERVRRFAALTAFGLSVLLCGVILLSVLRAVAPPPAPANVRPGARLAPPFTTRLVLVIVDGLRYDVATDAASMPRFAAAMRAHASGEIWAGRVSMTSSAILALGTGQPGRLEQVIYNVNGRPPPFDSWLENAAAGGLRLGVVGDVGWSELYGAHVWQTRLDPEGVAIDVNFNPRAFAGARELIRLSPDALILHFGTPDHQGHAYGIRSRQYTAHIRGFDADLATLLSELPPAWTVVVTSDHGAADSGTHGTDVDIQRRSPLYAYGPGIRDGAKLAAPADQLDLSATLPVLLGVPTPAHGLGDVLLPLLDGSAELRAAVACENAARVLSYATAAVGRDAAAAARRELEGCSAGSPSDARAASATRSVQAARAGVEAHAGLSSPGTPLWLFGIVLLAAASTRVAFPELGPRGLGVVLLVLAVTVALVFHVERLPSFWPNVVRAAAFTVSNAVLLALILAPSRVGSWLEGHRAVLLTLVPSSLVLSYPADCRVESFVLAAVLSLLFAGYGPFRLGLGSFFRGYRLPGGVARGSVLFSSLALLSPTVLRESSTYSELFHGDASRAAVAALLSAGGLAWLSRSRGGSIRDSVLLGAAAALSVHVRPLVGPLLGRAVWLGLTAAFMILSARRRPGPAIVAGTLSVLWVSRDFEALPLMGCLGVAAIVGDAVFAHRTTEGRREPPFPVLNDALLVTLLFALAFALRIGVQDGLEFGGMYWGAGAFNDPHVPSAVIGVALTFKYAMGVVLVALCLGPAFVPGSAGSGAGAFASGGGELLARALVACFALRAASLSGMFLLAGNSFWTALRVLGDLPTTLAMLLGSWLLVSLERRRTV